MRKEELFELLGDIDEDYVEQARQSGKTKVVFLWRRWFVAAAAVLAAVLILAVMLGHNREGDGSNSIQFPTGTGNVGVQSGVQLPGETGNAEVPQVLHFDSVSAYEALMTAAELSESELQAHLRANDYDMNGLQTKEDVLALANVMDSVPFPLWGIQEPEVFEIRGDLKSMFVRYRGGDQEVLQLRIHLDRLSGETIPEGEVVSAENVQVLRYTGESERASATALTYSAVVDGYYMTLEVFGTSRKWAENWIREIAFRTVLRYESVALEKEIKDFAACDAPPTFRSTAELMEALRHGTCDVYGVTYSLESAAEKLSEFYMLPENIRGFRLEQIVLNDTNLHFYYWRVGSDPTLFDYDNGIVVSYSYEVIGHPDPMSVLEDQFDINRDAEGYLYRHKNNSLWFEMGGANMSIRVPDDMNTYDILRGLSSSVEKVYLWENRE